MKMVFENVHLKYMVSENIHLKCMVYVGVWFMRMSI